MNAAKKKQLTGLAFDIAVQRLREAHREVERGETADELSTAETDFVLIILEDIVHAVLAYERAADTNDSSLGAAGADRPA